MTARRKAGSLFSDEPACFICGSPVVHVHHVYPGTGRRKASDREGCWLYLCPAHHNMSPMGVHFDRGLDARLRAECQRRWMEREGLSGKEGCDAFRAIFGASYV